MLSFAAMAKHLGMVSWSQAEPELHREVILANETVQPDCRSARGFDFIRGVYTTWITGPDTEGYGFYQSLILEKEPGASLHWKTEMVVLVDHRYDVVDKIRAGVIPQRVFESGWWAYHDTLVDNLGKQTPLHEYLSLERGVYKNRIKHRGEFYPPKKQK